MVIDRAATGIGPSRRCRCWLDLSSGATAEPFERGPGHARSSDTRRVHPRSVAARHQLGPMDGAVPGQRLRADRSGWPNEPRTVAAAREHPELVADIGIDEAARHFVSIIEQLSAPPVIVGHSFGGLLARSCSVREPPPPRSPSTRPRSRESCRCRSRSCVRPARSRQSGKSSPCGLLDQEGVPVRVRQRIERGRVRRLVRVLGHSLARKTTVPGCGGQLRLALAGRRRDQQRDPRAPSPDVRPRGPYGAGRRHAIDPQAVPQVDRGDRQSSSSRVAGTLSRSTMGGERWPTPS